MILVFFSATQLRELPASHFDYVRNCNFLMTSNILPPSHHANNCVLRSTLRSFSTHTFVYEFPCVTSATCVIGRGLATRTAYENCQLLT